MCWKVQCTKCHLYTWAGCGQHVDQIISEIPINQRCTCNEVNDQPFDDDTKIDTTTKQTTSPPNPSSNSSTSIRLLYELTGHTERVWCCSWNPNKTILATTSGDKLIKLWTHSKTENTFKCIQTLDAHTRTVRSISWHPNGNIFCSASFDSTIGIWKRKSDPETTFTPSNIIEFECIDLLEGHDNEVKSLSWDCTGKLLASCSRDKSVWIWEYDDETDEFEVVAVKRSHSGDVKYVQWHPFEPFLISTSYDDTIKTYKFDKFEDDWYVNQILKKHNSTVWNLAFNRINGSQFVSCSDDQSIVIWEKMAVHNDSDNDNDTQLVNIDEMAFKLKQCLDNVHSEPIYCVDWLMDKTDGVNVIGSCSGDNCIKFYHKNKSNEWEVLIEQKDAHKNDVNWIEFGPRIKQGVYIVATASDDGLIKIWEIETECDENMFKDECCIDTDDDAYNDIVNGID